MQTLYLTLNGHLHLDQGGPSSTKGGDGTYRPDIEPELVSEDDHPYWNLPFITRHKVKIRRWFEGIEVSDFDYWRDAALTDRETENVELGTFYANLVLSRLGKLETNNDLLGCIAEDQAPFLGLPRHHEAIKAFWLQIHEECYEVFKGTQKRSEY